MSTIIEEEVYLKISSVRIDSKTHEIREIKWWWCYKYFSYGIDTKFKRFCVFIEKIIRFIIRKPVKMSRPVFEVKDIKIIPIK